MTDAERAFLRGLSFECEDGGGYASLLADGTCDVAMVDGNYSLGLDAEQVAQWLVTAAHTAAALVHCADCRFWLRVSANEGDCTAHKHSVVSRRDCYCSWGEEKDAVR